jgi:hypothetical protein
MNLRGFAKKLVTYLKLVPSNKMIVKNELESVRKEVVVELDMIWKEALVA